MSVEFPIYLSTIFEQGQLDCIVGWFHILFKGFLLSETQSKALKNNLSGEEDFNIWLQLST